MTNMNAINDHGAELLRSSSKDYTTLSTADLQDFSEGLQHSYEERREHGTTLSDLADAFATIAAFFHDDDSSLTDDPDSPYFHPNNLNFQQRGMLNQLARNAEYSLQQAGKRLDTLENVAAGLKRKALGGEIDIEQLKAAVRQLKRQANVVTPVCDQYSKLCEEAYMTIVGEPRKRPVTQGDTPEAQEVKALLAELDNL